MNKTGRKRKYERIVIDGIEYVECTEPGCDNLVRVQQNRHYKCRKCTQKIAKAYRLKLKERLKK
jgi:hypothetical protein